MKSPFPKDDNTTGEAQGGYEQLEFASITTEVDATAHTPETLYKLKDALEDNLGAAHVQIAEARLKIARIHADLQRVTRGLSRFLVDARPAGGSARG